MAGRNGGTGSVRQRRRASAKKLAPPAPADRPPYSPEPVLPAVNPGVLPHLTPEQSLNFPIVGIGCSAGGLEALKELLPALPADTGMAFVVVQHLPAGRESALAEILARISRMPVLTAEQNTPVQRDHVYVIPPGKDMVLGDGLLQLAPRTDTGGMHRAVDRFLRSLAEEQGHKSIAVILSGALNDGTLGAQEVKAAGGITFAQDRSASHNDMPRSAIAAGCIDFVLPPDDIARELARIARHPLVGPDAENDPGGSPNEPDIRIIIDLLREGTGVDFGQYKRPTLHRRILRRMVLQKMNSLHGYARFLEQNPPELEALYQDILISVTSFFRNADSFEMLKERVFPELIKGKTRHEQVRVWALGCSTGEEAYSIAMLYAEFAEANGVRVPLQLFATDINGAGIERARSGIYNSGIAQDLAPERLRRFFVEMDGHYRIAKPIRDMCVFARQNVLSDPPFSRLDLIACRNMLIYLEPALQRRLMPILHYALRPGGVLWLGHSETVGNARDLFDALDSKHKIYQRKEGVERPLLPVTAAARAPARGAPKAELPPQAAIAGGEQQREVDRLLLSHYAPAGVVVNGAGEIIQFRGDTGPYLKPAPGRASLDLLKMLREGLLMATRAALEEARREDRPVRRSGLKVRSEGGLRQVELAVLPVNNGLLVLFEEPGASTGARLLEAQAENRDLVDQANSSSETDAAPELARLRSELDAARDYLQSVIEQQEATNEELQAANEEVQSSNEELQSINEELETSKEEIQSSNEELSTVNDELQNRNNELSHSNNDLVNLLSSVQMPVVMLDADLRIRRYTPAAEKLLSLISADINRPIGDIKLNLQIPDLEELLREVIDTVGAREREIQDRNGRWYLLRVRPYRTLENRIEGAVLVLVDIDTIKSAEQAVRESEARFKAMADNSPVLIWLSGANGVRFVNHAYLEFLGVGADRVQGYDWAQYLHPEDREAYLGNFMAAFSGREPFEMQFRFRRADGEYRWMKSVAHPHFGETGEFQGYIGSSFDISELKTGELRLLRADREKSEFLAMLAHELRNPLAAIQNSAVVLKNPQVPDSAREQAGAVIVRQTTHMVHMVDDLLDISRINHGTIALKRELLDLKLTLAQVVQASERQRTELGQQTTLNLGDGNFWVRGDATRIEQVIGNLLSNAGKFTPRNGHIWVTLAREPAAEGAPAWARLSIRDDGAGIEPGKLPQLFEMFAQDKRTSAATSGLGIGLALVKRLVEMHGGNVTGRSAGPNRGSEFLVRLPLAEDSASVAGEGGGNGASAKGGDGRVLIVDDNRDAANAMKLALESAGFQVAVTDRPHQALQAARTFKPRVALLDIAMPGIDGYELARRFRADRDLKKITLFAVTGFGTKDDVRKAMDAGFDRHLTKPADLKSLISYLQQIRH